ncbi:hypothetical protein PanWU01x14_301320, partial [Parasponia andersonii]
YHDMVPQHCRNGAAVLVFGSTVPTPGNYGIAAIISDAIAPTSWQFCAVFASVTLCRHFLMPALL